MSSIRAVFTAGLDAIIVHGLHQWDYGRSLEISHPDLPTAVEVHFGTAVSKEAIVHVATGVSGTATVAIPNSLLEQSHPITAWVYLAEDTLGKTLLTVTLPIQARPRPAAAPSVIPEEIGDRYTEALAAMNEAVDSVRAGDVIAAKATNADYALIAQSALSATSATSADNAAHATQADNATKAADADRATFATSANQAITATSAINDRNGNKIDETYASFKDAFSMYGANAGGATSALPAGTYQFKVYYVGSHSYYTILEIDLSYRHEALLGASGRQLYMLSVAAGTPFVKKINLADGTTIDDTATATIYYRKIH